MRTFNILLLVIFVVQTSFAQDKTDIKWFNPANSEFPVIEGQAWHGEYGKPYNRLPDRAETLVREPVWNLSQHTTGLKVRFRSNAKEIIVRYGVRLRHAMNHMPATGVSGMDLYAIDSDGQWMWCQGKRSFSDTIVYRYDRLRPNDRYHDRGREYRLNLPLYNSLEWMEIGVSENAYFEPLPIRKEKPIVVYGTSIAHGACASRPGMAWTNILSRKMDRPLINLAFSGNGRLEKEMIDFLSEIDAKIFIIDCMPNLWNPEVYDDEELKNRILNSICQLRKSRPGIPILLTAHAGYTDGLVSPERMTHFTRVNRIQKDAYNQLRKEGIDMFHYLAYEEIGMQLDDMVDGTHPNDLGMMRYADSYSLKLRSILNEPKGTASTTQPRIQYREPGNYDWEKRHREILKINETTPPKTVLLANSIVHFWGGLPRTKIAREEASWEELLTPMGVRNYAYGWDRIENVLWRVYHGELDGFEAERVMVMIGTNNLHLNTDQEIIAGLNLLIQAIKFRQPTAEIVLMGLLPRRDHEQRIETLNLQIASLANKTSLKYADLGSVFLMENNKIEESLFSDGLHPNKAGYQKLREMLIPLLKN
ncbi:SGNH/GDSL hydrolase family protein [Spongiimicrobium sp. 3-5]|uniref:SGNH/GDSL hydrolase family protein n=1 Tax=Spongiimicrobium sp. 3-5 TaxID=3332596 RepID=UPI00397F1160